MPTAEPAALDFDSSASSDGSTNKNQVVRRAVLDNAGAQLKDANGQPLYAKDVAYDANGNATRFPGLLATPAGGFWDPQNRMTVFVQGDPQAAKATPAEQYRHDAGGMRWYRLDKSGLPRLTLRDGAGQALAEYTVSPASGGGGTIAAAKEYVPGFGGVVAERTWTAGTGALPKVTFHHRDHLGSLRLVTDPSGTVVEAHDYYPFGGEMGAVGASSRRKFTGHERDEETGLDYMLARYYPASLGRFLSVDPFITSSKPALPQSWNRYAYTEDSPLSRIDPDGRDWFYANRHWVWRDEGGGLKYLIRFAQTGKTNGKGATLYTASLVGNPADKPMVAGSVWFSGGTVKGGLALPATPGNYVVRGSIQLAPPINVNAHGGLSAIYGIQPILPSLFSDKVLGLAAYAAWGELRARLNPAPGERDNGRGLYLHSQGDLRGSGYSWPQAGATHGCLAAADAVGRSILEFLYDREADAAVEVGR